MTITKQSTSEKLAAYLHHEITLAQLVAWAETAMMEDEFAAGETEVLRSVIGRIGLADVQAFGLAWEDCEQILAQLEYRVRVEVQAA